MFGNNLAVKIRLAYSNTLLKQKKKSETIKSEPIKRDRKKIIKKNSIKMIAIGISTGSPKALFEIIPFIPSGYKIPIVIVQHMPANFTKSYANQLNKKSKTPVSEINNNLVLLENEIYLAPGGIHTKLRNNKNTGQYYFSLVNSEPVNNCRQSVDVFFESLIHFCNEDIMLIIMTGMGNDGSHHLTKLAEKKAHIIAQDEESSVVWGMPESAVKSGAVDEILSLTEIKNMIVSLY